MIRYLLTSRQSKLQTHRHSCIRYLLLSAGIINVTTMGLDGTFVNMEVVFIPTAWKVTPYDTQMCHSVGTTDYWVRGTTISMRLPVTRLSLSASFGRATIISWLFAPHLWDFS